MDDHKGEQTGQELDKEYDALVKKLERQVANAEGRVVVVDEGSAVEPVKMLDAGHPGGHSPESMEELRRTPLHRLDETRPGDIVKIPSGEAAHDPSRPFSSAAPRELIGMARAVAAGFDQQLGTDVASTQVGVDIEVRRIPARPRKCICGRPAPERTIGGEPIEQASPGAVAQCECGAKSVKDQGRRMTRWSQWKRPERKLCPHGKPVGEDCGLCDLGALSDDLNAWGDGSAAEELGRRMLLQQRESKRERIAVAIAAKSLTQEAIGKPIYLVSPSFQSAQDMLERVMRHKLKMMKTLGRVDHAEIVVKVSPTIGGVHGQPLEYAIRAEIDKLHARDTGYEDRCIQAAQVLYYALENTDIPDVEVPDDTE